MPAPRWELASPITNQLIILNLWMYTVVCLSSGPAMAPSHQLLPDLSTIWFCKLICRSSFVTLFWKCHLLERPLARDIATDRNVGAFF
jgi:hypothetical protein